jgi:hypothetical protein
VTVILATQRLRWEDYKFKASLENLVKPCLKKNFNPKQSSIVGIF